MADGQPTRRKARVVQGPNGDPQVEIGEYVDEPPADEVEQPELEAAEEEEEGTYVVQGEDKITVRHTYSYVAGNQTQFTTVGCELVAQPGDTAESLFIRGSQIATNGCYMAAEDLTDMINARKQERAAGGKN